ncbi:hypothetical protein ATANTOWER_025687 [Ataeniobius toweri]|uniref:Secreted protein n=1 Tax=Ataeniobius toweri TaxID=208326 RepID=A0ABU7CIH2_9TELE|nr:hypothetical protein [Ataeniobius toweri]
MSPSQTSSCCSFFFFGLMVVSVAIYCSHTNTPTREKTSAPPTNAVTVEHCSLLGDGTLQSEREHKKSTNREGRFVSHTESEFVSEKEASGRRKYLFKKHQI